MLTLNTLQPHSGSTKARRRVGRGNSSGRGNYSGRGLKGQKARSGVSGLKRHALKPVSYTHLRAHETVLDLVCRLLLDKYQYQI